MNKIQSVTRVEAKAGCIEFELALADGSTQQFSVTSADFADFISRFSAATFAPGQVPDGLVAQHRVAFEPGTGRVWLGVRFPDGRGVQLTIGHEKARDIGHELIEAADKSTAQGPKH